MILDDRQFSSFEDWADRMTQIIDRYGSAPTIISMKEWPRWAATVCEFPAISGQQPPSPTQFKDWRAWAQAFNQSVNLNAI